MKVKKAVSGGGPALYVFSKARANSDFGYISPKVFDQLTLRLYALGVRYIHCPSSALQSLPWLRY